MALFCQVVLADAPRAIDKAWTYRVPGTLADQLVSGSSVLVPFGAGKQPVRAFVTEFPAPLPEGLSPDSIREIHQLLAGHPLSPPNNSFWPGK